MKKINLILCALACLLTMSWTACTEDVDYTPTVPTDGVAGVYFPDGQASSFTLAEDTTAFSFFICRTETAGEKLVNLVIDADSAAATQLTIPTSVTFADGDSIAEIIVTYDPEKLVRGESYTFTASLAITDAMNYMNTAYEATAKFPVLAKWKSIGKGTYHDAYFFYEPYEVEFEQDSVNPNKFRLHLPYMPGFENTAVEGYEEGSYDTSVMTEYLEFRVLQAGETLNGVEITKTGLVSFGIYNTGFLHPSYGDYINIISPASFSSFASESALAKSYVKAWQDNGLPAQVQLAPYYYMMSVGGWNYSTADDMIVITFPDVVLGDFSIDVKYAGQYTDSDGLNTRAVAKVSFGADVESAKVAMAKTSDYEAVYNAMTEGSIETVELADSGYVSFPLDKSGFYTIVAVSIAEDKEQEVAYATFEYTGGGAIWESMGTGLFADGVVGPNFFAADDAGTPYYATYEVEIQRHLENEGVYRLVNPYAYDFANYLVSDQNTYIEINAQDPQCAYIPLQSTGLSLNGDVSMYSMAAYLLDQGTDFDTVKGYGVGGTMTDNVITFAGGSAENQTGLLLVYGDNIYFCGYPTVITLPTAAEATAKSLKATCVANKTMKLNKNLQKYTPSRFVVKTNPQLYR